MSNRLIANDNNDDKLLLLSHTLHIIICIVLCACAIQIQYEITMPRINLCEPAEELMSGDNINI